MSNLQRRSEKSNSLLEDNLSSPLVHQYIAEVYLSVHMTSDRRMLKVLVCLLLCLLILKMNCVYCFFFSTVWQVDIPSVFADKVMKAAMKHIEIIAKAQEKGLNLYQLTGYHYSVNCNLLIYITHSVIHFYSFMCL